MGSGSSFIGTPTLTAWARWDAARSWREALEMARLRREECLAAGRSYMAKQYIWRSFVHEKYTDGQFWIISGMPRN
jgi:hypothetical protein